jgi:ubiquinone/menaquinone biosynthesis C-methylase UbiE
MEEIWAKFIEPSGQPGLDYWNYFARRTASLATIPQGAAILDIGTYDGNVLFRAMEEAGPRSYGIGVDIYGGGLRNRIDEAMTWETGTLAFAQMDAAALGFPFDTFDSVLANFVGWDYCFDFSHMEFIGPDPRMPEIMRVLKPGGQVGIGFWIKQDDIDWMAEAFNSHLPEIGEVTWNSTSSYGKENPEGYKIILETGGFQNIIIHVETTPFVLPDAETWWQQMKMAASDYFQQVPDPDKLKRFKEQVFTDLRQSQSSEDIHFHKTVAYAFGTKIG